MLTDEQLLRYSSNVLVDDIGESGQRRLLKQQVLVIGLGGLGCPASQYLASSGVGQITLMDHDTVSLSNLQRQTLYRSDDIGRTKAHRAQKALANINSDITLIALPEKATQSNLDRLVKCADLVLDCTDNRHVRYQINAACYRQRRPFISASARGLTGQIVALHPDNDHGCYQCLYPSDVREPLNCRNAGIIAPVVGILGASQALQAIHYLCGNPISWGTLQCFDGLAQRWQQFELPRATDCPQCGGNNAHSTE